VGGEYRLARVERLIAKEVADILTSRVMDPAALPVTVLGAKVSRDLGYADIFVSVLGDDEQVSRSLAALARCRSYVQQLMGARVRLRKTPRIRFRLDEQYRSAVRVFEIFRQLEADGPVGGGGDSGDS